MNILFYVVHNIYKSTLENLAKLHPDFFEASKQTGMFRIKDERFSFQMRDGFYYIGIKELDNAMIKIHMGNITSYWLDPIK